MWQKVSCKQSKKKKGPIQTEHALQLLGTCNPKLTIMQGAPSAHQDSGCSSLGVHLNSLTRSTQRRWLAITSQKQKALSNLYRCHGSSGIFPQAQQAVPSLEEWLALCNSKCKLTGTFQTVTSKLSKLEKGECKETITFPLHSETLWKYRTKLLIFFTHYRFSLSQELSHLQRLLL